jgi:hypothetical protein
MKSGFGVTGMSFFFSTFFEGIDNAPLVVVGGFATDMVSAFGFWLGLSNEQPD